MGAKATGQKVEWRDRVVSRFANGKICEEWTVSELAGELLSKLPAKNCQSEKLLAVLTFDSPYAVNSKLKT